MATKTLNKTEKVYNILKSGKRTNGQVLTKKVYGEYNENNYKKVRSIISRLRINFGYAIDSLGDKMYKMN